MLPTELILSDFKIRSVGRELVRSELQLNEVFGEQGGMKILAPLIRRAQADMVLVEEKRPAPLSTSKSGKGLKTWDR